MTTHPSDEAGTGLPVAWRWRMPDWHKDTWALTLNPTPQAGIEIIPLYTQPPSPAFDAMREALEVAEKAYLTGILNDDQDLWGQAIRLRRAALQLSEPHHEDQH